MNDREVLEETAATWVNLHDHLRVLHKRSGFLWSSERTGFRHLEVSDAQGGLVGVLTKGDWPVDEVLAVDRASGEVWFRPGRTTASASGVPCAAGRRRDHARDHRDGDASGRRFA